MSSKIFRSICIVAFIVLAASLTFIMGSTYGYFSSVQAQQIQNQTNLVADGLELAGEDYVKAIDIESVRVTWISEDGTVLFDNEASVSEMENHLERPEVIDAIKTGFGESSRYSSTLMEKQFYCAKRLDDGSIVRVSDRQNTVITLLLGFAEPVCMVILVVGIIAFLLASNLSKKLVEPINNIDLDDPLAADTYDEVKPLLQKLDAQRRQIEADKVELDLTEQIRREFTANVSHELKTPLHVISGYAELMKSDIAAESDIKPFANKIFDESRRMSRLVEDVIDLSKIDDEVPDTDVEEVDLYQIAANAIGSLEPFAEERNISIRLLGTSSKLTGYSQLIHSIVYNLCDNAIKYNHDGGSVTVTVWSNSLYVRLIVEDTGIGIPEEHQSRVFERFYRVDKSHSKEVGGTGLGLSIVKHAAQKHDASIVLKSESGKGTRVEVKFPKYTEEEPAGGEACAGPGSLQ